MNLEKIKIENRVFNFVRKTYKPICKLEVGNNSNIANTIEKYFIQCTIHWSEFCVV